MKGFVHASYNFFGQCILGDRSLKVGLWAKGKCIRIMLGIGKFSSTGVAGGGEISWASLLKDAHFEPSFYF